MPTTSPQKFSRKETGFVCLVLFVLAIIFYARALQPGQTFIADVLFRYFLGPYSLLKEALALFELPFWNPYLSGGAPGIANAPSAVFYPGTYLFALFDFGLALKVHVILHAVLAGYFMAVLSRQIRLPFRSSLLAGVVYALNGFAVYHFQLPAQLQVYAWTPAVAFTLCRVRERGTPRDVATAAIAMGMLFVAGYIPFMVYGLMIALGIALSYQPAMITRAVLGRWICIFALGAALAAVQLGPLLDFALQSSRAEGLGETWALAKSLTWKEIFQMGVFPLWNWYLKAAFDTGIAGFYWGLPVLALSVWALRKIRTNRLQRVLLAFAILGLLIAAGRDGGIYPFLVNHVWPFGWLRYPSNALLLTNVAVALLAGWGLEKWNRPQSILWIAICVVDLGIFAQRAYETIPSAFYREVPSTAAFLQNYRNNGRIYMTPPSAAQLSRSAPTRYEAYQYFADSIMPNYATVFRLHDAAGGSELQFARVRRVLQEVERNPNSPWLNAIGARYLLSFWDLPGLTRLWRGPSGIGVYENSGALPRASFVTQARTASMDECFEKVRLGQIDLRQTVCLEPSLNLAESVSKKGFPLHVEDLSPNRLRIYVEAPQPGWVVLSDSYDHGWQVRDAKGPVTLYRANFTQQAVAVPAGTSLLEWRYRPWAWQWLQSLSVLALFLIGGLLLG